MTENGQPKKRLRKQPKMKRVYSTSAVPLPQSTMPKTVKKRKRLNSQQRLQQPLGSVKHFVFTSRWLSLGLLAAAVYALYVIGGDGRFYLDYIPVEGSGAVKAEEVVAASGLAGHHIFAADPQEAADAIAQIPGVISSTVTLSWPNEVNIQIREDPPLAIWQEGEQSYWVVDSGALVPARVDTVGLLDIVSEQENIVMRPNMPTDSTVLDQTLDAQAAAEAAAEEEATEPDKTATADKDDPAAASGETDGEILINEANAAFVPADVLAGALQLRQLRPNIDKLYYRPSGGLSYQDGRGWRAYFGTGRDMHQKLVVYERIVEDLLGRGQQPTYISVSNQEKPFYMLAP